MSGLTAEDDEQFVIQQCIDIYDGTDLEFSPDIKRQYREKFAMIKKWFDEENYDAVNTFIDRNCECEQSPQTIQYIRNKQFDYDSLYYKSKSLSCDEIKGFQKFTETTQSCIILKYILNYPNLLKQQIQSIKFKIMHNDESVFFIRSYSGNYNKELNQLFTYTIQHNNQLTKFTEKYINFELYNSLFEYIQKLHDRTPLQYRILKQYGMMREQIKFYKKDHELWELFHVGLDHLNIRIRNNDIDFIRKYYNVHMKIPSQKQHTVQQIIPYFVKYNYYDDLDKVLSVTKCLLVDDYNFPYEVSAEIKSVFHKHKFYTTLDNINKNLDNINKKRDEIESIVRYETITMIEKLKEEIDIDFHTYGETTNRELAQFIDELQSEFTKYREITTHQIDIFKNEIREQLKSVSITHDHSLNEFREKQKKQTTKIEQLERKQFPKLRDDLVAQIASFRTDFQQKHIAEIAAIREEHRTEITAIREEHHTEIATIREEHRTEMTTIREEHALEVTKLREELAEMRKLHESTLALLVSFASQTETKLSELSQK